MRLYAIHHHAREKCHAARFSEAARQGWLPRHCNFVCAAGRGRNFCFDFPLLL